VISFIIIAFWYGRRSAKRKFKPAQSILGMAELDAGTTHPGKIGKILNAEERAELERRRRAADLGGAVSIKLEEIEGGERAELETRRKAASDPFSNA
jgi:hypothetical protein